MFGVLLLRQHVLLLRRAVLSSQRLPQLLRNCIRAAGDPRLQD
jgi:hypothetical protein